MQEAGSPQGRARSAGRADGEKRAVGGGNIRVRSNVRASGLNPPPTKTVLTPRSAESCLKHGNPEVLRTSDLESFYDPNIDPAIQRASEAYSQRRHEMMQLVPGRQKIINAETEAMGGGGGGATITTGDMAQQAKANARSWRRRRSMMKMRRQEKRSSKCCSSR